MITLQERIYKKLNEIENELQWILRTGKEAKRTPILAAQKQVLQDILKEEKEDGIFAQKTWRRSDIIEEFRRLEIAASEENINTVIAQGGTWPYLTEHREDEKECIREEIEIALGK